MPIVPVIPKDNVRLNQLIKACSGYVTLDDVALWVPSEPNEEFDGWLDRAEPKLQKLAAEFEEHIDQSEPTVDQPTPSRYDSMSLQQIQRAYSGWTGAKSGQDWEDLTAAYSRCFDQLNIGSQG